MTLTLVVGQAYLGQSLERTAGVVAVQSILSVLNAAHDNVSSHLCGFSHWPLLFVEKLCSVFDGGTPGVTLLGLSIQVSDKLDSLRSLDTMSFHLRF